MAGKSPELFSELNSIVSIASVSSCNDAIDMSNKAVIDYLANQFENMGFSCEIVSSPSDGKEKFNLIATLGSGPGGLVLAGHTDTVPLDEELWDVDPFKLTEKDGKIFGLGITDMKGFFPIVMEAVKPLLDSTFKEPLIVLATADEETSMQGARTLAEMGKPRARSAIIGEPTGLQAVRSHKGIMMESIRLLGESGHSSNPALGNNALEAMHLVIADLMLFREELKQKYRCDLFEIPFPTLNLGVIHGGDNPNRICGHCNLEFDIRLTPGMHIESLREEIKSRVRTITDPLKIKFELRPLFSGVPAFFAEENSAILQMAEELTGHSGINVAFGTEAPFLQELGMDTIVLGPGNIDQAHQPNEYMSVDMINPCINILQQLIKRHCLI
ncbi:MAG: acetylornithine deacetylase [Gammaproteobacteria bacterium]|jgi:acetylornithine deacetylase|nr:acetylornithine deacetylase [Gammaproteobacteria bacterium]MBT3860425.1 acetylornithine deacetylase [Gammaproteobacteria bacterium]MBT3988694.1 acetylornithine deacetylase [Gammaproteobacteria bacterium]MBT4255299.1 acetylornithine deacetylase [Gammaproteobacteria bacterium]MBT4581416.1 acetylornithine deacetylase [Gammaproteobacteria bacterium]